MVAHLIQRKGRGGAVVAIPMLVGFVLFVAVSVLNIDDKYVRDLTLIISSVIILALDSKKEIIEDGVMQKTGTRPKGVHQFIWIEMRWWAIAMGALGVILLTGSMIS